MEGVFLFICRIVLSLLQIQFSFTPWSWGSVTGWETSTDGNRKRGSDGMAGTYTPRVGFTDPQINIFLKILFNLHRSNPPPPSFSFSLIFSCLFSSHILISLFFPYFTRSALFKLWLFKILFQTPVITLKCKMISWDLNFFSLHLPSSQGSRSSYSDALLGMSNQA